MKNSWLCRPVSVVKVNATVGAKASQLSVLHLCVCVNNMFAHKANPSNRANSISLHRTSTCVYAHKWVSGRCQCVCTVHLSMGKWIKKKSAYYKGMKKMSAGYFSAPSWISWPFLTNIRFLPPFKSNCRDFPSTLSFQFQSFCELGSIVLNLLCCGWIPPCVTSIPAEKAFKGKSSKQIIHYSL